MITWQTKIFISPLTKPLWPLNLRGWLLTLRVLYSSEGSQEPLVTRSCKVMWQNKTILSPLPKYLWPLNLIGWRLTLSDSHHIFTWSLVRMILLDHVTISKIYHPLSQELWPLNLGWWLRGGCLARKRLSRHWLLVPFPFLISVFGWTDKSCLC